MRFFPYLRNPFKKRVSINDDAIQFNLRSVIAKGVLLKPGEIQMVNFYDHKIITKIKIKCTLIYDGYNAILTYKDVDYVLNNDLIHNDPIIKKLFSQYEHEFGKFYDSSSKKSKSKSKTLKLTKRLSRSSANNTNSKSNSISKSKSKNRTKKYGFN